MHWEEGKVNADKEGSEMNLTQQFVVGDTNHLLNSVVEAGKDRENGPHRKDVVKVRNNVVGIVERDVKASVCKDDTGNTTNSE